MSTQLAKRYGHAQTCDPWLHSSAIWALLVPGCHLHHLIMIPGRPGAVIMQAVAFFWASWSAPCKHMAAVLEALAQQHPSIAFLKVASQPVTQLLGMHACRPCVPCNRRCSC